MAAGTAAGGGSTSISAGGGMTGGSAAMREDAIVPLASGHVAIVPNIFPERIAFGFIFTNFWGWPIMASTRASGGTTIDWKACWSTCTILDLPVPDGHE